MKSIILFIFVFMLEPSMKAYPNPFTEKLYIEFSHNKNAHARLDIYSITGARLENIVRPKHYGWRGEQSGIPP